MAAQRAAFSKGSAAMAVREGLIAILCLALPASAAAQAYQCDRPSKPHIPVGSHAESWQMDAAKQDVERYVQGMKDYLACLKAEHDETAAEARQVIGKWNEAIDAYKQR
jgi:hypothetical protein